MTTIYGIKSCDTMKKAFTWLDTQQVSYDFHDYKKQGIDPDTVQRWLEKVDHRVLINRRGTTWRKLSDADKAACDSGDPTAIAQVAAASTSVIKRPVVDTGQQLLVGFDAAQWADHFSQ
ncbi:MAG: arsenate reductase [Natronospirillum sp.]